MTWLKNPSWRVFPLIAGALLVFIASCGGGSTTQESAGTTAAPLFDLRWPEGYSYDPATATLTIPVSQRQTAITTGLTVTSITCTVTGSGMTAITASISPTTLQGTVYVPLGSSRVFSVTITTSAGLTITGSSGPINVTAGFTDPVSITLAPNNPPVITSVTSSNMSPMIGDNIIITCNATDPDAGDQLSYTWTQTEHTPTPVVTTLPNTTSSFSFAIPNKNQFMFTCAVSDFRGGSASGFVTIGAAISAPTGILISASPNTVSMTWPPVANAASYNLYWSTSPGVTPANGTKIVNAGTYNPTFNDYAFTHAGLTNGVTYYYVLTAVTSGGVESAPSTEVSVTPASVLTPPGAPTAILVSGGANSVGMTWSPVASATSYNLYWSTSPGVTTSTGTKITNVGTYNSTYNDYAYNHAGLTASTTYYYILTAVNSAGESSPSPQASATTTAAGTPLAGLFADANLAACVTAAFPTATTTAQVTGMLDCGNKSITNLSGIENLTGLTQLNLGFNLITNVAPLSNLTGLTWLYLGINSIVDVTPLASLTRLIDLTLGDNLIVNVTPLASLTGLNTLYLSGNQIVDVTPLAGLTSLTTLQLAFNPIGGQGVGNVHLLTGLTSAQIWLYNSPSMSCSEATTLITALGTNVDIVGDGVGNLDTPANGVNCTSPAPGVTWTARTSGTANHLRTVIWSGTQFVAAGDLGTILTSPDGVNWTAQNAGTVSSHSAIAWSGTQFMVVGENAGSVFTSPDAVTWTGQNTPIGNWLSGIAWSGNLFVAVGQAETILTSPDGVNWTAQLWGLPNWLNGVVWSGARFVVVGANGTIWTSLNGLGWSGVNPGTANALYGVTWSGSQYLAVGANGAIITSPDVANWTPQSSGTANALYGVTWSGSQYLAVGANGTIITSPDGVTWTSQSSGTANTLYAVTWSGTNFVTVGINGTILTSP